MPPFFMGDWDEIYLSYGGYMLVVLTIFFKYIRISNKKIVIIKYVCKNEFDICID